MSAPTLVVAGFDQLAQRLEATGFFPRVVRVSSTSGLRDAIRSELSGAASSDVVFLFADNLPVDTPQNLDLLVGKLTSMGFRVVVLEASPRGQEIVLHNPKAGLVSVPHSLNKTLGSLAGVGVGGINPVDGGHAELHPDVSGVQVAPDAASWSAPDEWSEPAAAAAPDAGATGGQGGLTGGDPAGGWGAPAAEPPAAGVTGGQGGLTGGEPAGGWAPPAAEPPAAGVTGGQGGLTGGEPAGGWGAPGGGRPTGGMAQGEPDPWAAQGGRASGLIVPDGYRDAELQPTAPGQPQGVIIAICAPKGGVGKSTVALNLGAYFGRRLQGTGRNVCVVDANFQQADSGKYLGKYTPNITDLARADGPLTPDSVARQLIHRPDLNLSVLLGPATPLEASPHYINGSLYRSVSQVLRRMYSYIIVDTPVAELFHDIFDQFVLPESDFLVVTVAPNTATLINTHLWLRTICSPGPAGGRDFPESKVGILLNRAEDNVGFDEDDVRDELPRYQFLGSIPETTEWKRANNQGQLVATQNYTELNTCFARVLYAATRDPALEDALVAPESSGGGLLARLRGRKRR